MVQGHPAEGFRKCSSGAAGRCGSRVRVSFSSLLPKLEAAPGGAQGRQRPRGATPRRVPAQPPLLRRAQAPLPAPDCPGRSCGRPCVVPARGQGGLRQVTGLRPRVVEGHGTGGPLRARSIHKQVLGALSASSERGAVPSLCWSRRSRVGLAFYLPICPPSSPLRSHSGPLMLRNLLQGFQTG